MKIISLLTALAVFTLSGCSQTHLQANLPQVQHAAEHPWAEAIEVTTQHYRVVTNSDQATAEDIGAVLESVYATCENILGPAREPHSLWSVYAFTSKALYNEQLATLRLPQGYASGIFTPSAPAGIYLPLVDTNHTHPFFTLVHEGLHQYLHEAKGFAIDNTQAKLPPVPLWLSEGLALYLEAALTDTNHLQPGKLHPPRLKHLQKLLQRNTAPKIRQVIGKTYGEPFSNADYSVAWGLVYTLRHNPDDRDSWKSFWSAWQEAAEAESMGLLTTYSNPESKDLLAIQQTWAKQLSQLSEDVFRQQVLGLDQSWATQQKQWGTTILRLTLGQ